MPAKYISRSAQWQHHQHQLQRQLQTPMLHLAKNLQQILVPNEVEPRHGQTFFLQKIRQCFLAPVFGSTIKAVGTGDCGSPVTPISMDVQYIAAKAAIVLNHFRNPIRGSVRASLNDIR